MSITGGCAIIRPWEAVLTGAVGGMITIGASRLFDRLKVDDPVGAISVHGVCGFWVCIYITTKFCRTSSSNLYYKC